MKSTTKTETEVLNIKVEFARALEVPWRPGISYTTTTGVNYVRPTVPNGFEYECTNAGQSANKEPQWPTTIAETIADGSVVWTCRDFGTKGTDTISSESVTADTGLTVSSVSSGSTATSFTISGGTSDNTYEVSVEVTTLNSVVLEEKIKVTISGD